MPVRAVVGVLARGAGDPTCRFGPDGAFWWARHTPDGPALLRVRAVPAVGEVEGTAWGSGAGWVLDGLPELLGDRDDPSGFVPAAEHPRLREAWRAVPGLRVPRTRAVFDALAAAALEQRVTGAEARRAWCGLVRRYGEPAPGPATGAPFRPVVPPEPRSWREIPSWEWLRAGVDGARRRAVLAAAEVAGRLEATVDADPATVAATLRSLPGVGVWTAAEVRHRAHGDPDAFSWGDYHVGRDVAWALAGRVLDDDGCAELIERYRGHRYRVQRLVELAGIHRPRRGPRQALPHHLPGRSPGRS